MRILVLLIPILAASACARPQQVAYWPDHFFVPYYPQLGYAIKRVIEKQAPITLVAHDGSVCRTSRQRFARTRTGKWVACIWNWPTLDSTETAQSLQPFLTIKD